MMNCPKCGFEQDDQAAECLRCGVIFAKIQTRPAIAQASDTQQTAGSDWRMKDVLLPEPLNPNPVVVAGRGLLLVLLVVWSFQFVFASICGCKFNFGKNQTR